VSLLIKIIKSVIYYLVGAQVLTIFSYRTKTWEKIMYNDL